MQKNKFIFRLSDVCTLANSQTYSFIPSNIHTEIRNRVREREKGCGVSTIANSISSRLFHIFSMFVILPMILHQLNVVMPSFSHFGECSLSNNGGTISSEISWFNDLSSLGSKNHFMYAKRRAMKFFT